MMHIYLQELHGKLICIICSCIDMNNFQLAKEKEIQQIKSELKTIEKLLSSKVYQSTTDTVKKYT